MIDEQERSVDDPPHGGELDPDRTIRQHSAFRHHLVGDLHLDTLATEVRLSDPLHVVAFTDHVGYTEWSPEAGNYDPDKSAGENARSNLYNNTIGGAKQLATRIASGDPEAIGEGAFVAVLAKSGGGRNPTLTLRMPVLAIAEVPGFGRIPVIVTKPVVVTVPASEALAAANTGAAMMTGGDGGGGGQGKGTGTGKGSKGFIAKNIGGTKPIPKGTNLALGMAQGLGKFTAALKRQFPSLMHGI